jgi:subtilisin
MKTAVVMSLLLVAVAVLAPIQSSYGYHLPVTSSSHLPSSGIYVPKLYEFQVPSTIITPTIPALDEGPVDHSSISKSPSATSGNIEGTNTPDQYIVVLKPKMGVAQVQKEAEVKEKGVEVLDTYGHALNGFLVRIANNQQALDNLKKDPDILTVERDQTVHTFESQESPEREISPSSQSMPTGIDRVDADLSSAAAGDRRGTVNTDIAILDTGVDLTHPDLNVFRQQTFVGGTSSAMDDNGHGTHVAGIAAAKDNGIGSVGVAPGARLWAIKVLDRTGSGSISTILKGIDYITQHANEIDVVNMSFGCACTSSALDTAIKNSVAAGVTYVVAAGNSHKNALTFSPANNPNVIAVSAIVDSDGKCGSRGSSTNYGKDDYFASFSNYGSVIDMSAPGVNIFSTYQGGTYATLSGTSMAAPHVTGAAALYKASHPAASPSVVANGLINLGSNISTICDGNGHGYFQNDPDNTHEPLLYAKNL